MIERIRYSHDAMIDMIVASPGCHQNDLARAFGYSAAWVSTIISSDAFQARLAARREEVVDPHLRLTLEERTKALCARSLEVLMDKLSAPSASVPDNLALRAYELGAKGAALGANAQPPSVSASLEALAHRLIDLNKPRSISYEEAEEVEVHEAAQGRLFE